MNLMNLWIWHIFQQKVNNIVDRRTSELNDDPKFFMYPDPAGQKSTDPDPHPWLNIEALLASIPELTIREKCI